MARSARDAVGVRERQTGVATVVDGWQGPRGGRRWEEELDGVLHRERWDDDAPFDEPYEEPWRGSWGAPSGRSLGRVTDVDLRTTRRDHVTTIVLIGDRVVDVVTRPTRGSEYECAALELDDARY
ncbi:MAG: hypothetical protein IE926_17470, partial [Micrococcales bacterium]|nr:hypothetical protein [Micrococcales bacterium]